MNYQEALNYINDMEKFGSRPGLREITKLMETVENKYITLAYNPCWRNQR